MNSNNLSVQEQGKALSYKEQLEVELAAYEEAIAGLKTAFAVISDIHNSLQVKFNELAESPTREEVLQCP